MLASRPWPLSLEVVVAQKVKNIESNDLCGAAEVNMLLNRLALAPTSSRCLLMVRYIEIKMEPSSSKPKSRSKKGCIFAFTEEWPVNLWCSFLLV